MAKTIESSGVAGQRWQAAHDTSHLDNSGGWTLGPFHPVHAPKLIPSPAEGYLQGIGMAPRALESSGIVRETFPNHKDFVGNRLRS